MSHKNNKLIIYKRDKNKIEINGEADFVKWQIWFDLISIKIFWLLIFFMLCYITK